jgi:hypothetical protein
MTTTPIGTESGIGWVDHRRRAVLRVAALTSGLAVALICGSAAPAMAAPVETKVHVEGRLLPVAGSEGVYRVTGGLVGSYKLQSERVINAWTYWTTEIRSLEGTELITGCVDQNLNEKCDPREPSGELKLTFTRVASFDTTTGRLIESNCIHPVNSSTGRFAGGLLTMRDLPIGDSDQIHSTYQGEVQVTEAADSQSAD